MAEELRHADPEEAGMSTQRISQIVGQAERWVAEGQTRALVVLVARRGQIVLEEAFGTLLPERDSPPVQPDTIFPLASITKVITATAMMCLVEDGLVGLNRAVQEYIPEFVGEGKDRVMIHHLLTHTSGLSEDLIEAYSDRIKGANDHLLPAINQSQAVAERIAITCGAPLSKPPGTEWSYCDEGFVLLGDIVRRVSGKSLADNLSERIFARLGMGDTSLGLPGVRRGRLVRRPATSPNTWLESPDLLDGTWPRAAAGGGYGTARDLAVFGQMFLQHGSYGPARVLSAASVAAMTRNQIPGVSGRREDDVFSEASWGLGWNVRGSKWAHHSPTLLSDQTFEHHGSGGVWLWVDPVREIVGVYLSLTLAGVSGFYAHWNADLFVNGVIAAIDA